LFTESRANIYAELESSSSGSDDLESPSDLKLKHGVTKKIKKIPRRKKKYRSITDEMREQLIDAVENNGEKIKQVLSTLLKYL